MYPGSACSGHPQPASVDDQNSSSPDGVGNPRRTTPSTITPTARRPAGSGNGAPIGTMFGPAVAAAAVYTRPSGDTATSSRSASGTGDANTCPVPRDTSNAPYRRMYSSGVSPSADARSGSPGT